MGYRCPGRPAAAIRRRHVRHLSLLVAALFSIAGTAHATSAGPAAFLSPAKALASLGEPDLMEAAYREGMRSYEARRYTDAVRAWRAPAEHGHAAAQFSLGVAYATGHGVARSLARAIHWWKMAARGGYASAQLNLGLLYWRGVGVAKDLTKARTWWRRAAEHGDPAAEFQLGAMAATGDGIPINYDEAARWWRLSAAQGYTQAIKGLEILRQHGLLADTADASADASTEQ